MITSFKSELFDLTGQMNAVTVNKINVTEGEALQVYIPKIMPNIPKGSPSTTIVRTNGSSVFKNGNKKPTMSGFILREKNYFETKFNAMSNIDDLNKVTKMLLEEINRNNKKLKYEIKKDTNIRVEFLNGKLNHLSFMTLDNSDIEKKLVKDPKYD